MYKMMRNMMAVVGIAIQVMIVLVYGFTEIPVSSGMCMMVWCACGMGVFRCLNDRKAI